MKALARLAIVVCVLAAVAGIVLSFIGVWVTARRDEWALTALLAFGVSTVSAMVAAALHEASSKS